MTENMRRFLEVFSANRELADKVNKADKEELIAIAKGLGFELSDADFIKPAVQEMDDDELDAVAGGGACVCALGGGGTADNYHKTCACVAAGVGLEKEYESGCYCTIAGYGMG